MIEINFVSWCTVEYFVFAANVDAVECDFGVDLIEINFDAAVNAAD